MRKHGDAATGEDDQYLPWMTCSPNDIPPAILPTGHIFLVYES
jgi:hypothetical protein